MCSICDTVPLKGSSVIRLDFVASRVHPIHAFNSFSFLRGSNCQRTGKPKLNFCKQMMANKSLGVSSDGEIDFMAMRSVNKCSSTGFLFVEPLRNMPQGSGYSLFAAYYVASFPYVQMCPRAKRRASLPFSILFIYC